MWQAGTRGRMCQADGTADQKCLDVQVLAICGFNCGLWVLVVGGKTERQMAENPCKKFKILLCTKGIHLSFKARGDACAFPYGLAVFKNTQHQEGPYNSYIT